MKKTVLLIMTMWLSATCFSAPITRSQARAKASEFLAGKQIAPERAALKAAAVNGSTASDSEPYYVFNVGAGEGFVIVSGDDRTTPILGYTEQGSFSDSALPDNVKAWLQSYKEQIQYLRANEAAQVAELQGTKREQIPHLIKTTWNQLYPYNSQCPMFFDFGRSAAGCVSVALAQLIYYYQWPTETQEEIPAYDCPRSWGEFGQLHVDGIAKGTKLQLSDLKTWYPDDADVDAPSTKAVASLIKICGAAVQMDYADEANGGSQASNNYAIEALMKYFDFAKTIRKYSRKDYNYNEWESMIYDEISAKRPILFGGTSSDGGHSFLMDGYKDGLFHINWGWGGLYDGHYALSVLNPGQEGAFSRVPMGGYTMDQTIFVGIKKNEGEASKQMLTTSIFDLVIDEDENHFIQVMYWNNRPFNFKGERSIAYVNEDGSLKQYGDIVEAEMEGYNRQVIGFPIINLEDGTYKFVPISRPEGTEEWLTDMDYRKEYVEAVVADGDVKLTWHKPEVVTPNLVATNFGYPGNHRIEREQNIDVTIQNKGEEFYGPIYLLLNFNNGEWQMMTKSGVTVLKDASTDVSFCFTPDVEGTYGVRIAVDEAGTQIIGESSLQIIGKGETGENVFVDSLAWDNVENHVVKAPYLSGKLFVENKGKEEFDGEMIVYFLANSGAVGEFSFADYVVVEAVIPAGKEVEVPFKLENATTDWYYWPLVDINDVRKRQDQNDIVKFEYDITAVESVKASVKGDDAWYTISGQRVAKPTKGLYIHQGKRVLVR